MAQNQNPQNQTVNEDVPKQLKHIQDWYLESWNFLIAWKRRKVRQLVLLNNLQRGDENIASTLLLTLFNRVLSNLYDDKMQVKFLPSQGITQDQLNSFNTLAQSDYLEMNKGKLDYDWCWDALFFNRGYVETYQFNKKRKIMEPCVINPLVFGYDPYFEEVQDWRYYWKWITKSKVEVKRLIKNGSITGIKEPEEIAAGVDEYLWNYRQLRDRAKKAIEPPPNSLGADVYQILEFYAYDDDGDKCCYWLDRDFSKILYEEKLDFEDLEIEDETKKGSKWPIVVKEVFREPHASINFGIPDLLEDKHRAKSVLLNLAFIAAKDKANPTYLYNPDKIKDVTQFLSRQINQHIPVEDVQLAVQPLNTEDPMSSGLMQFITLMQQEANEPIGTGVSMQPEQKTGQNTATEAAIDQQLNDIAQSLQSKIMQFGEQEFWSHWFHRYALYSDQLGDKIANIVGVKGINSQIIDLKDFNTDYPPGVLVYSAKEAEYKELVLRRDLMQLYPNLQQTLDQDGMRNFNKYVFFPKFLQDPSLVDVMLPKTIDEMKAEAENEQLAKDEMPQALPTDNHTTHIYTHHMVQPKTWATWFHIEAHEQLLAQQKSQQMQAQQQQLQQGAGQNQNTSGTINSVQPGAEKQNPLTQTAPIATEMNPSNNLVNNNAQNTH
jgi:hypothetical protein